MKNIDKKFRDYVLVHLHNPFLLEYNAGQEYKGLYVCSDLFEDDCYCKFESIVYGVRAGMVRIIQLLDNHYSLEPLIAEMYLNEDVHSLCQYIYFHSNCRFDSLPDITSKEFESLVRNICLYLTGYKIPSNVYQLAFSLLPDKYREFFQKLTVVDANVPF